jgi:HSP20 family protein
MPEGNRYYRRERPVGAFTRTVTLPEPIDPGSVNADYRNGVLKVHMTKAEQAKPRKVKIAAAG